MNLLDDLSSLRIFERPVAAYLLALALIAVVIAAVHFVRRLVVARLRRAAGRTTGGTDDMLVELLDRSAPILGWLLAIWLAARQLALPDRTNTIVSRCLFAIGVFVGARIALDIAGHGVRAYFARRYDGDDRRALVLRPILSVVVWAIALVFVLDNLGVKVSTVLAGLGIGGIAVALAAQAVLGDLFSYVAIILDRPFAIGDFIVVDSFMGTVEHIGVKTTRVRSLGGELLVFGNAQLLANRIRNYRPMERRRVQFGFGLCYDSSPRDLAAVPELVKEIVSGVDGVSLDRAHFKSFGESSLDFEVVYWVNSPDYNRYMDIQQTINLALKERVESLGLAFAFPTRTLHVSTLPATPEPAALSARRG